MTRKMHRLLVKVVGIALFICFILLLTLVLMGSKATITGSW